MSGRPSREDRFTALISDEVHRAAWNYAWRLCANSQEAEDLLQDALVKAFQRLDQLKDDTLVKGWLFSIVRTLYLDGLRKSKRDKRIANAGEPPENHGNAESDVVRDAVAALPLLQREVVELFHFDELSLAQTAAALDVSVNNVKNRLFRARRALKRRLNPSLAAGDLEGLL